MHVLRTPAAHSDAYETRQRSLFESPRDFAPDGHSERWWDSIDGLLERTARSQRGQLGEVGGHASEEGRSCQAVIVAWVTLRECVWQPRAPTTACC